MKSSSSPTRVHLSRTGSVDIFSSPTSSMPRYHSTGGGGGGGSSSPGGSSSEPYTHSYKYPHVTSDFPTPAHTTAATTTDDDPLFHRTTPLFHHHHHQQQPHTHTHTATKPSPPTSSPPTTVHTSSKAVLSALRTLQEKIKRLENERSSALWEVQKLRIQLEDMETRADLRRREETLLLQDRYNHVQLAYERVLGEKAAVDQKLAKSEEKRVMLAQEATRLREKLVEEEGNRVRAEERVRGVEVRITEMEEEIRAGSVSVGVGGTSKKKKEEKEQEHKQQEATIQKLEEALEAETERRLELEARNEKFGEVLLSVMDMNQDLVKHFQEDKSSEQQPKIKPTYKPSTTSFQRRKYGSSGGSGAMLPFLPVSHHRTYNLLATLSQAVRECKEREPKQVLDALYELVQQEDSTYLLHSSSAPSSPRHRHHMSSSSSFSYLSPPSHTHTHTRGRDASSSSYSQAEELMIEELEEVEALAEDELRGLTQQYRAMVELAAMKKLKGRTAHTHTHTHTPTPTPTKEFREEDLRALIEAIHRKEAELKRLRRALRHKRQHHPHLPRRLPTNNKRTAALSPGSVRAAQRMRERLTLLSGIRDVAGHRYVEK